MTAYVSAISRQVSSGAASSGGRSRCPSGGCYPYDYHQSPSAGEASTFEARIYPVFDYGDCLQFDEQAAANCFAMEASSAAGGGLVDTGSSAGRSDLLLQELAKINSLEQQLYNLQQQQQRQQQSINAAYQSAYYPAARMSHQQQQHHQHQQQQQQVLQSVSSSMVYSPNFAKSGHAPGHSAPSMFGSASAAYYSAQDAAPPSPNESDRLLTSSSSSAVQGALSTGSTTFENQAFFGRSTPARRRHQQQQPNPQLMPVANNSIRGQYFGFNNS